MIKAQTLLAGGPLNGAAVTIGIPDDASTAGSMLFPDPNSQVGGFYIYQRAYPDDTTEPWIFRFVPTHRAVPQDPQGTGHPVNN